MARSAHHVPSIDHLESIAFDTRHAMILRGARWEVRVGRSTYWTEAAA